MQSREAARSAGSYALTVKAEYLVMAALYYFNEGDILRVQKEVENFHRLKKLQTALPEFYPMVLMLTPPPPVSKPTVWPLLLRV